jgi:transposase InsO family protein
MPLRRRSHAPQQAGQSPEFNAAAECFATLECELLARHHFLTRSAARLALFDHIEGYSNTHRRHSTLGYLSPAAYESRWTTHPTAT